jgi:hypothetical protein
MRSGTIAALWMLLLVSSGAAQNTNSDTAAKILVLERVGKLQACELKDERMLNSVLHDRFVYVDQDGRLTTKAEFINFVKHSTSLRYASRDMTVRLHEKMAIVTGLYQIQKRAAGKFSVEHGRFIDTWLEESGRWVVIASITIPLT